MEQFVRHTFRSQQKRFALSCVATLFVIWVEFYLPWRYGVNLVEAVMGSQANRDVWNDVIWPLVCFGMLACLAILFMCQVAVNYTASVMPVIRYVVRYEYPQWFGDRQAASADQHMSEAFVAMVALTRQIPVALAGICCVIATTMSVSSWFALVMCGMMTVALFLATSKPPVVNAPADVERLNSLGVMLRFHGNNHRWLEREQEMGAVLTAMNRFEHESAQISERAFKRYLGEATRARLKLLGLTLLIWVLLLAALAMSISCTVVCGWFVVSIVIQAKTAIINVQILRTKLTLFRGFHVFLRRPLPTPAVYHPIAKPDSNHEDVKSAISSAWPTMPDGCCNLVVAYVGTRPELAMSVTFDHYSFQANKYANSIMDVNFTWPRPVEPVRCSFQANCSVAPGEFVYLNVDDKCELANLPMLLEMFGLYTHSIATTNGEIRLDDNPIKILEHKWLRQSIVCFAPTQQPFATGWNMGQMFYFRVHVTDAEYKQLNDLATELAFPLPKPHGVKTVIRTEEDSLAVELLTWCSKMDRARLLVIIAGGLPRHLLVWFIDYLTRLKRQRDGAYVPTVLVIGYASQQLAACCDRAF